ncbi:sel1 repeat family protein [Helicobacter suis]|uniref:sel1 repeat family protein n=1 Tax=Helicobacter suis TaxID=104628 RepID=UPI0013D43E59|nr:sel1 repeat family protein [Helicobacter suis]
MPSIPQVCAPSDLIELNPHVQEGLIAQSQQQDEKAYQSFLAANKEGDLFGTALLGTLYLDGKGVQKNTTRAETYFNEVLKSHEVKLKMKNLEGGDMTHSSVTLAAITARLGLAQIYESTNPKKAFKTYKLILKPILPANPKLSLIAAFAGALTSGLGYLIFAPFLRPRLKHLHANNFNPYARGLIGFTLYKMGMAYKEGRGVKVKLKKATEFLKKAVDFGNDKAIEALRSLQH